MVGENHIQVQLSGTYNTGVCGVSYPKLHPEQEPNYLQRMAFCNI